MIPFLLGKIQDGKLKAAHIPLMKDEIVFRTQQVINDKLGIRALALILCNFKKGQTGKDSKRAEDWNIV